MSEVAKVKAMNTALSQLGQEPVTDLTEASLDGSVAARKLLRVIDDARDTVLRRHMWLCAKSWDTLSPAVLSEPSPNWRYPTAFYAPGDCLRVWEIGGIPWSPFQAGGWGPMWEVNTVEFEDCARVVIRAAADVWGLAAPLTSLEIAYVRRANWSALDPHVRDAVAYETASRGAYSVTADLNLAARMEKAAEAKVLQAIGADGTQEGGQAPIAPSIPQLLRHISR